MLPPAATMPRLGILLGAPFMRLMSLLLAGSLAVPMLSAAADPPGMDSLQQLRQELQQEQQHIKQLEERLAADEAAQAAAAQAAVQSAAMAGSGGPPASTTNPSALVGSFGANGYTLQSADGANSIHFRGNVSTDGRYYSDAISFSRGASL